MGAGLSSSASLEVSTGRAFLALAGRKLAPQALALACQESEHTYVGIRCGIMDQTVASRARPGHALLLDCLDLSVRHVPIQLEGWCFAAFDTGVRHELASSEYNKRRAQCEHAAKLLGARTLRQATIAQLLARGGRLSLDEHRRARHVLTEDLRVLAFAAALRKGDPPMLGRLLLEGHASLAQDYEVSCKELDVLVKEAVTACDAHGPRCLGARMTGGGFGGAIVALIKAGAFEAVRAHLAAAYRQQCGRELATALVVEPGAGARVVPL
jgi:galactokinase